MPNKADSIIEIIFAYDKEVMDCKILEAKNIDSIHSKLYFCGIELKGGTESKNAECFFGEENSNYNIRLDESKPIYYLQGKEEKQSLKVFLNNHILTIFNYSIKESSLNIHLECLSKESLEQEKLIVNSIKEQEHSQRNSKEARAKLHALLENQNLECIHGGKVILKSNKGKSFKDNNIPIILESDLLNSSIVSCPYTLAGTSYPCTKVVDVKGSLSQKKVS